MNSGGKSASIRKSAADRTAKSLMLLRSEIERLKQLVHRGELDKLFKEKGNEAIPSSNQICVGAGLGRFFLYGQGHKGTTSEEVRKFREDAILELEQRTKHTGRKDRVHSDELKALQMRHQKLADHAHVWHRRMRELRSELKELRATHQPKIVSINPKPRKS